MSDFRAIARILSEQYGDFNHYNRKNPLEELIFIICSTKTDEEKYRATFASLRRRFRTFRNLLLADVSDIAEVLRPGGLSQQKAALIKEVLLAVTNHFGRPTLSPLREYDDQACEAFLLSLPRIGKKTARCVMMYSLDRQVFPVDTHCWRIAQRLGWIEATYADGRCTQKDMDRLQEVIPKELRYSLHVNLISHGRSICTSRNPRCGQCPVGELCPRVGVTQPEPQP